ncbi:gliding motility lipoprotein GldB [Polaribacter sp.]|jgi:gliding motility-associated lipoprotein GldB|nr:gliding motility lipoprotein GldB [Polaribacter sp.]MDC1374288.1 gliding motility lipoprotein GldB [Polaribacter sp.]
MISLILLSCKNEDQNSIDVSNIEVDFAIERFEEAFYNATPETLVEVKKRFPLLFPSAESDSVWLAKINNKDEQNLFKETQVIFSDFNEIKKQFASLFKHITYYNPRFKAPKVITMLSNIDYENRVVYADSLLLISLDVYLGKQHEFYADYPMYIKENNTKEHLIVDVANAIIHSQFPPSNYRSFSSKIIEEGKKMYLLDVYLPSVSEKEKTGYTFAKLAWAKQQEEAVWKFFIENELLYSTDTKLNKRFIENAPFSKFYTAQDNQSPGKIGSYIGWQIVRSFMKQNDVSLQKLITIDAQSLLDQSKYKPKK